MGWVIKHSECTVVNIFGGLPNGGAIRKKIGGL
jgi:hypothetical protein